MRLSLKANAKEQASEQVEYHRKFHKNEPELALLHASCLRVNGELVRSRNVADELITMDPMHAEAYVERALLKLSENNLSDAAVDL